MTASSFRRQVNLFIDQNLSPQAQSARLASFAKEQLADVISRRIAPPDYTRYVDGVRDAPEEAVKPTGLIRYKFEFISEIIVFALGFLKERGPPRRFVTSGNYDRQSWQDSFWLSLDGKFVLARRFNPETMGQVSEVFIGNTRPYNRKVEVQRVGKKTLHFSKPAGTFQDCRDQIKRRYGNMVDVEYERQLIFPDIYRLKNDQIRVHRRGGMVVGSSFRRKAGDVVESPGIVITVR